MNSKINSITDEINKTKQRIKIKDMVIIVEIIIIVILLITGVAVLIF